MIFLGIMDYTIVKETVLKYQKVLQFIKNKIIYLAKNNGWQQVTENLAEQYQ